MASKTYSEKLLDPRWQKKRLEILNRDNFTCQFCDDEENTLHVHHYYYENGKEPWEYPDYALVTLCKRCHKDETDFMPLEIHLLGERLKEKGAQSAQLWCISKRLNELPFEADPVSVIHFLLMDPECFEIVKQKRIESIRKFEQEHG